MEVQEMKVCGHKIILHKYGDPEATPIFMIPVNKMEHVVPSLIFSGFQVIIVFYPGIGDAPGKALPQRSELILEKDGPGDIIMKIISNLGFQNKKVAIGGYDWGSTVALRVAANQPNKFSHVVAFHPSMGNTKPVKDELAKIMAKTLVLWIPADMFHPWSKWKNMPASIPNCVVETVKIHPWNAESVKGAYRKFSNQVCIPIVKFLTGKDPVPKSQAAFNAKEVAMASTTGKNIKSKQLLSFAEDITEDDLEAMMKQPDVQQDAIDQLKAENFNHVNNVLLSANHPDGNRILRMIRCCPPMTLETMQTPDSLVNYGIWPEVKGW